MPRGRVLLAAVVVLLTACGGPGAPAPDESSQDLFLPDDEGTVPLVVLVPGGGWSTADPAGLTGLAQHLADAGVAASLAHIRAGEDGVVYPVPVEDVLCEVAEAAARVAAEGFAPDPVVVLGHSSGAHLAALAVLTVRDQAIACADPEVVPDALVGISGPYDISRLPGVAATLMGSGGPAEDPETWAAANPVEQAERRPGVPALLLHGDADEIVPVGFSTEFAAALEEAGHPTTLEVVPGADHFAIFEADVAGPPVVEWLLSWSSPAPAA